VIQEKGINSGDCAIQEKGIRGLRRPSIEEREREEPATAGRERITKGIDVIAKYY
jgi:hypothetical protein